MTTRPFNEVVWTYRSRLNGLKEEYRTLYSKWTHLGTILSDDRILPDLSNINIAAQWLLNQVEGKLLACEEIATSKVDSKINTNRDKEMRDTSDLLFRAARFLSFLKSAFYQRTVSLEIPYVIAGLPVSPETRWGDESYLIAADSLIADYTDQLNLHGFPWSGFTSYAQMHHQYRRFPGASYSNFSRAFHIALSPEMKYFFNGFVIVSHELGHATIESYVYQLEREVMPVIMYRFMYIFYLIKTWTKTFLHSSVEKHHCKGCTFDEDLCKLSRQKNDFNNFIDNTEQYPIVALTNEAASDVIGLTISGPYFPRALFDYAFRNIITLDGKGPPELDYDFKRLLTRISACYSFARVANLESKDSIRKTFNGIVLEAAASIRLLPNPYDKEAIQCVSCLMKLGSVIGSIFGMYFREVFKGAFARNSGKVADIQFRADPTVANRIRSGYAVCDSKPRQIIHACLELMDRKCEEPPAALFSLANNKNLT